MRKYLKYVFAAIFVWMASLSIRAEAAGTDAFRIDESGTVTIVSPQAAGDGAASLQFSLSVNPAAAANIEFRFRESSAKVQEFRYDQNTKQLNVYIAGTEALFAENTDTLTLGTIVVLDGSGGNAAATVSVVADSFAYVHGTELKTVDNMTLPGSVQMRSDAQSAPTPQPTQKPAGNNNSQGNNNASQGGNNIPQGNNDASLGGVNNNMPGSNNASHGSANNSQGNNNSSQGGGSSQEKPNSSQEDNNGLQGDDNSSQSGSDSVEIGDDSFSSVWNPAEESEELTADDEETANEMNWMLALAIVAALVIAAGVAAGAAVLYKKQSRLDNRRKR